MHILGSDLALGVRLKLPWARGIAMGCNHKVYDKVYELCREVWVVHIK